MIPLWSQTSLFFYGLKAKEAAKALGKEDTAVQAKVSLGRGKLPEETQVLVLG